MLVIRMEPLVFEDRYWRDNRLKAEELYSFFSSLPSEEQVKLTRALRLERDMYKYYIVPRYGSKIFHGSSRYLSLT